MKTGVTLPQAEEFQRSPTNPSGAERGVAQILPYNSEKEPTLLILDFGLLASRTVDNTFFCSLPVYDTLLMAP